MSDIIQSLADVIPSHLKKEVERVLINGWRMREIKAKADAKQQAAYSYANEASSLDGVGELKARIPVDAYHYWGQRFGSYDCWSDNQFLTEFLRDNPETAVRNYAKKTVVNGAIFTADGFVTK
jgi:hypothetical protein